MIIILYTNILTFPYSDFFKSVSFCALLLNSKF